MAPTRFTRDRDCALELDERDELAPFRQRFHIPRSNRKRVRYLCGHSLGLMPKKAERAVDRELERWRNEAVEGHFSADGWYGYHERFARPLARLAGAKPDEIVAMNSLTVNLHLMLVSFYRPTRQRHAILIESGAFPSDRYAVVSQIRHHGLSPETSLIEWTGANGPIRFSPEALAAVLADRGRSIALVLLPGVQYLSGEALDIKGLAAVAADHGCRVGFDLGHAIGNVPLGLHESDTDFAVWCSYKYLNGGPGAIGGCFVHARHGRAFELPRLAGWWGHDKRRRFAMEQTFRPIAGAEGWQLSNPPIFAMAPLEASLEIFIEAGPSRLRKKSTLLTRYLEFLLESHFGDDVKVLTPSVAARRGAQLSIKFDKRPADAARIASALRARQIVVDVREPDVLRIAPVPLYNRYRDVFDVCAALKSLA